VPWTLEYISEERKTKLSGSFWKNNEPDIKPWSKDIKEK
jgi:hypothetical protein